MCTPFRLAAVLTLLLGSAIAPARADLIFFKDGFVIEGKLVREGSAVFEGGQAIWMPKGFFYVDDHARRIYFSPLQIQQPTERPFLPEGLIQTKKTVLFHPKIQFITPPIGEIVEAGPWGADWHRKATLRTPAKNITFQQHLTQLTPRFIRMDTANETNYKWTPFYLTDELPRAEVRKLLIAHPDLKETADMPNDQRAVRRYQIYDFFVLAGWYDMAAQELDLIEAVILNQKEVVKAKRVGLKKLLAQSVFDQIKLAHAAGQYALVVKKMAEFPEEGIDEKLLTQFRDLRSKYETAKTNSGLAKMYLKDLPTKLDPAGADKVFLTTVAAALIGEVGLEDFLPPLREIDKARVGRLDTFVTLARQCQAQIDKGQKPAQTPEQLLSLAITGWLLGAGSAEEKTATAERLWKTREFVLAYQKTELRAARQKLLDDYLRAPSGIVPIDEITQLIPLLPPAEPLAMTGSNTVEMQAVGPLRKTRYLLKLPPEYSHQRAAGYPVLIALPDGGARAKDMIERWATVAAEHGYILAVPEWEVGLRAVYNYTAQEHAAVLDVVRDLRRRVQVDSDRVLLFGQGEGGNMAYDVGLAHPDLFAGILPMSAKPQFFAMKYFPNAQHLPFYVVGGDYGDYVKPTRTLFEEWVPRAYPVMFTCYRGRGYDWYGGEVPHMMDWMDRKVRANPNLEVGKTGGILANEMATMRPGDNRFYWISTDSISPACQNDAANWRPNVYPAKLHARISPNNQIGVVTSGVKQVTLWLGRGTTLDFDNPLTIYLNITPVKRKVQPSLETLMEDLFDRGDRQRLVTVRLDFKL